MQKDLEEQAKHKEVRVARGGCQAQQVAPRAPDGAPCATADDGPPLLSPCLVTHQTVWVTGWST